MVLKINPKNSDDEIVGANLVAQKLDEKKKSAKPFNRKSLKRRSHENDENEAPDGNHAPAKKTNVYKEREKRKSLETKYTELFSSSEEEEEKETKPEEKSFNREATPPPEELLGQKTRSTSKAMKGKRVQNFNIRYC